MRLLDAEHGKDCLGALALLLPTPLKFVALRRLFGWEIAPSAQIGLSLFVNVREVRLADGVRIGHFNVFRNLGLLDVAERSVIGQWN